MCVPLTLMTAGMGAGATAGEQVAGGLARSAAAQGVAALGSLASGVMQSRAARADAEAATADGQARARRIRTAGQAEVSRSRVDAIGAGVSVNSGSALQAERQIVQNVEQDALSAIATGASRASAARAQGQQAMLTGALSAFGSIYGAADKWKRAKGAAIGSVPLGGGGGYVPLAGE